MNNCSDRCIQLNSDWLNCNVAKEMSYLILCGLRNKSQDQSIVNSNHSHVYETKAVCYLSKG